MAYLSGGMITSDGLRDPYAMGSDGLMVELTLVLTRSEFPFSGGGVVKDKTSEEILAREDEEVVMFVKFLIQYLWD